MLEQTPLITATRASGAARLRHPPPEPRPRALDACAEKRGTICPCSMWHVVRNIILHAPAWTNATWRKPRSFPRFGETVDKASDRNYRIVSDKLSESFQDIAGVGPSVWHEWFPDGGPLTPKNVDGRSQPQPNQK